MYDLFGTSLSGISNCVTVAASNTSTEYKDKSDYVCTGKDDQIVIQQAINSLNKTGGTVYLATGDYYIDGWTYNQSGYKRALFIDSQSRKTIRICGQSIPLYKSQSNDLIGTAILHLTENAIADLDGDETRVSIIGYGGSTRVLGAFALYADNIGIMLADNQHNIIAIDGIYFTAMIVSNIRCGIKTLTYSSIDAVADYPYPVENCIGIRGLDGGNGGTGYRVSNCFVNGYGTAYIFNGEHLIAEQLGCRYCNYSYKFGYDATQNSVHDMTLINCCHEFCSRYPAFNAPTGQANKKQAISFYNYNVEDDSSSAYATVSKAVESSNGAYRGQISYTVTSTANWQNIDTPFFESGSGSGFEVINTAYTS